MKIDIQKQLDYFQHAIKKFQSEGNKREVENCEIPLSDLYKLMVAYQSVCGNITVEIHESKMNSKQSKPKRNDKLVIDQIYGHTINVGARI